MPNVISQRFESFLSFNRYRYLWVALALMVVAIGCYVFAPVKTEHNGGTWFGYTLGVISVGLMVWLAALGLRKRLIRPGKFAILVEFGDPLSACYYHGLGSAACG